MNFENKPQSLLTFRVGPVLCCAPSLPVRSIITPPKLTHPPGSGASQPGIFKHGSRIVKVLDLRQKFGVELSEQTQPGNFIITIFEKDSFAFWVDQILDVFDFPSKGWGDLPPAIPRGVFSRTLLLNKKIHLYAEFENLASINNLGYMKNYIQQLNELQTTQDKTNEKVDLKNIEKTQHEHVKDVAIAKDKNIPFKSTTIKNKKKETSSVATKPFTAPKLSKKTVQPEESKINNTTISEKARHKPKTIKPIVPLTKVPPSKTIAKTVSPTSSIVAKQVKQEKSVTQTLNDNESSSFGIVILFIILISLAVGIYYLFDSLLTSDYKSPTTVVHTPTNEYSIYDEPIVDNNTAPYSGPDEESSDILMTIPISQSDDEALAVTTPEITEKIDSFVESDEDAPYRASISQQDNDITITLHQPVEETKYIDEIQSQPIEVVDEKPILNNIANDNKTIAIPGLENLNPINKPKEIISEVLHIVVKGDTLWAIAKKYVHNPFLYPELARLSNIKNPHRIYPGNRVRIRFIKK